MFGDNNWNKFLEEISLPNEKNSIISKEDYEKAEKEINEHMREFDIEWRYYMNQSKESARIAFVN